ncbi:MAG: transcription elongation factor GreA [Candidatus Promineifilaceae bacterium]
MLNKPVYVTEKGKADLEKQLEYLSTVERQRIIDHLTEVKSGGDWMENSEQMMFEDELAYLDHRIQELEDMIADAQLIGSDKDYSVVNVGDTVVIQDCDGELETYRIIGVAEADPSAGLISNESPLGQALLTHKVGDEVVVNAPAGELCFTIIAVK